jgi:hypothetical protein
MLMKSKRYVRFFSDTPALATPLYTAPELVLNITRMDFFLNTAAPLSLLNFSVSLVFEVVVRLPSSSCVSIHSYSSTLSRNSHNNCQDIFLDAQRLLPLGLSTSLVSSQLVPSFVCSFAPSNYDTTCHRCPHLTHISR